MGGRGSDDRVGLGLARTPRRREAARLGPGLARTPASGRGALLPDPRLQSGHHRGGRGARAFLDRRRAPPAARRGCSMLSTIPVGEESDAGVRRRARVRSGGRSQ